MNTEDTIYLDPLDPRTFTWVKDQEGATVAIAATGAIYCRITQPDQGVWILKVKDYLFHPFMGGKDCERPQYSSLESAKTAFKFACEWELKRLQTEMQYAMARVATSKELPAPESNPVPVSDLHIPRCQECDQPMTVCSTCDLGRLLALGVWVFAAIGVALSLYCIVAYVRSK